MWKNLPFRGYVITSLALNVILGIVIFIIKDFLPPVIPLFYGLPSGTSQLVPTIGLVIAPTIGFNINLINITIASFVKDLFFKKTLAMSSMFVSVLVFITTLKIILLVGFF